MSDTFQTILIIGVTSGIGEGLARRFHAQGKKVIITGRRQDRLDALTHELPGLSAHQVNMNHSYTPTPNQISEPTIYIYQPSPITTPLTKLPRWTPPTSPSSQPTSPPS